MERSLDPAEACRSSSKAPEGKIPALFAVLPGACCLLGLLAATGADNWNAVDPKYRHASPEAVEKWRDLKFGLRICMGQYTQWNIEASWPLRGMSNEKKQEYFNLSKIYTPSEFSAEEWMDLLQRGGLAFFTILTKHHA